MVALILHLFSGSRLLRGLALCLSLLALLGTGWGLHGLAAQRAIETAVSQRLTGLVSTAELAAREAELARIRREIHAERLAAEALRLRLADAQTEADRHRSEREHYAEAHPVAPGDCRVTSDLLRRLPG